MAREVKHDTGLNSISQIVLFNLLSFHGIAHSVFIVSYSKEI